MGAKTATSYKEVFYRVEWEKESKTARHWDNGITFDKYWDGNDQDFSTMQEAAFHAVNNCEHTGKWRIVKVTTNSETTKEVID